MDTKSYSNYKGIEFVDRVDLINEIYKEDKIDIWKKVFMVASKILFGIYSMIGIRNFQGIQIGIYEREFGK